MNGENIDTKNPSTTQQPTSSTTQNSAPPTTEQQTTTIVETSTVMTKQARKNPDKSNYEDTNQQSKIILQDGKLMEIFEKCIDVNTMPEKSSSENGDKNATETKTNKSSEIKKTDSQSVIKCIYGEVSSIVEDPYEIKHDKICLNALNKLGKDREIKLSEFAPEALKCFKDK